MIINKEFLHTQYIVLKKSGYQITKEFNLPDRIIYRKLRKFGIEPRPINVARIPNQSKNIPGHKWCSGCGQDLQFSNFSKNHRNRFGLDAYCKQCSSKKSKRYFSKRTKDRQLTKAKLIMEFGDKCVDCNTSNLPISSYTFHHHTERMNHKDYISPTKVITYQQADVILREKKKWVLLCANCHNLRHSSCKLSASELLQ